MLWRVGDGAYFGCDHCSRASRNVQSDRVEHLMEILYSEGWRFLDEDGQPDTTCTLHSLELKRRVPNQSRVRKTAP